MLFNRALDHFKCLRDLNFPSLLYLLGRYLHLLKLGHRVGRSLGLVSSNCEETLLKLGTIQCHLHHLEFPARLGCLHSVDRQDVLYVRSLALMVERRRADLGRCWGV